MSSMITTYLIQAVLGSAGGWLGNMLKANGLGTIGNIVAGLIGGVGAPAAMSGLGMLGGDNMIMSYLTSLVGGGLASLIGGLFKKA